MTDLRLAAPSDADLLLSIARDSGLFSPADLAFFAEDVADWASDAGDPRLWLLAGTDAAAHAAPEPMSDRVWNLLFLGVRPGARRRGLARTLLARAEAEVRARGARMLLIDTASLPEMAPARALYGAAGYVREATVRDYYGDGADRVTYVRKV